jgi:NADPH2:quinone reductase
MSVLGEHRAGTHAQFVVVPAANVHAAPEHLSDAEAAALPLAFCTAWRMVVGRAQARPGEWMLVWGASAGVGCAAVQIARHLGVRTIATTRDAGKADALLELGANAVIVTDGEDVDVAKRARELTGGAGPEVVFDHLGKVSWKASVDALAKGGRLVTCGATTGPNPPAAITRIFWKQLTLLGSTMATKREFADMLRFVSLHQIRPLVDREFDLADISAAHAWMEGAEQTGKIVLRT